jgi:hypothetical protein
MAETGKAILSTDHNSQQKPNQQKHWTAKEGRDDDSTKTDQGHLQGKKTKHVDSTHGLQNSLTKNSSAHIAQQNNKSQPKKKTKKRTNKQANSRKEHCIY